MQRFHFIDDEARFFVVVRRGIDAQLLALAFRGPEILSEARLVLRDHGVRRVENVSLRAVVLLELYYFLDAVVADELVYVSGFRSAKPVNRLIVISDSEHATVRSRE